MDGLNTCDRSAVDAHASIPYIPRMKNTTRSLAALLIALLLAGHALAQGSSGEKATFEPRFLIDMPTAGMLPHNTLALDLDFYHTGGLLVGFSIGLFDRLDAGLSYGGVGIIGTESPAWNNSPGFHLKVRLIEESILLPAIALGFDSQGKEEYVDPPGRYVIKSRGIYAVASKNYSAMGSLSLHGGVNYSLERGDDDTDPDFFVGIEKTIGAAVSAVGEYDLGLNDTNADALGRGRGYLNVGVRASLGKGLTLCLNLKDLLRNQQTISIGNRTISIEFLQPL
jgi:hypothetical protein